MLRTYCPECDFPQTIAETTLGQPVQCRGCKHTYTAALPTPEIIEPVTEAEVTVTTTRATRRAKRAASRKHTTTFLGLLTSSLLTLALMTGGIIYMVATLPVKKPTTGTNPQFNNYTPVPIDNGPHNEGPKKIDDLLKEAPNKGQIPIAPPPPRDR